ncbi:hypothetical protein P7C70_g5030, partial [Phenoliferia sp. Uapishka_3]
MPALSPTMTEGAVSEWKFKEGESFVAGDVLLAIETDKAGIDVEAQDDGIMGKIVPLALPPQDAIQANPEADHELQQVQNGSTGVQVGEIIALLAEEGDDISNLVVPASTVSAPESAPTPAAPSPPPTPKTEPTPPKVTAAPAPTSSPKAHAHPKHSRPLLPSVMRLLSIAGIEDASVITATGHKGMLTKGDVLAFLGEIPNARGSEKKEESHAAPVAKKEAPKKVLVDMDGASIRRLMAIGLGSPSFAPNAKAAPISLEGFDDVLDQYLPPSKRSSASKKTVLKETPVKATKDSFDSVLGL